MAANDSYGSGRSGRRVTAGASQRFVAATEEHESGTPVISVMGEVDLSTSPALEQTVLEVEEDRAGEMIVDLSRCSFLDSSGLRALLATAERSEQPSKRPAIVLSNPSVMRIFQLTKYDALFEIYPTVEAAVNGNSNSNSNSNGNGNGHA